MVKPYNNQYHNQKVRAKIRGIEWHFNYEEWINWWGDDIVNRGSRQDQLCMARFGDTGPYHPDNVRKATIKENNIEASLTNKKVIVTPIGTFAGRKDCAMAYKVTTQCVANWLKLTPNKFYYTEDQ